MEQLTELVNGLWADLYSSDIDNLLVGKLPSGTNFFGFVANDMTPYVITFSPSTPRFLNVGGAVYQQTKFKLNAQLEQMLWPYSEADFEAFDGQDGAAFRVDSSDWLAIQNLLRLCANEVIPYWDMSQ